MEPTVPIINVVPKRGVVIDLWTQLSVCAQVAEKNLSERACTRDTYPLWDEDMASTLKKNKVGGHAIGIGREVLVGSDSSLK